MRKLREKIQYWGGYWLPSMVVGSALSVLRRPVRPERSARSVAVFLLEHLGDAVISVPMLRELRRAFPQARIVAVMSAPSAPVLASCPYLDEIIRVARPRRWWAQLFQALALARRLARLHLDLVVVPKDVANAGFNELAAIATPAGWKISMKPARPVWRIKPMKFGLFYDEIVVVPGDRHEVFHRLETMRGFAGSATSEPRLECWLEPDDLRAAQEFLDRIDGAAGKPLIAFGIGASKPKRCWPLERYAEVVELLGAHLDFIAIVIAGPEELAAVRKLAALSSRPVHHAAGATIGQSAALISRCSLFIGNDSGPMHIAASLQVPVVEVSCHPVNGDPRNFNSAVRYGPFGVPCRIVEPEPLAPCDAHGCRIEHEPHCITQIGAATVLESALGLWNASVRDRHP